jgi:hypothetical protein
MKIKTLLVMGKDKHANNISAAPRVAAETPIKTPMGV